MNTESERPSSYESIGGGIGPLVLIFCVLAFFFFVCSGVSSETTDPVAASRRRADGAIEQAKASLAATLKDPGSVQWQNLRAKEFKGIIHVCGEFNAKNSVGGYVGWRKFAAVGKDAAPDTDQMYPVFEDGCLRGTSL